MNYTNIPSYENWNNRFYKDRTPSEKPQIREKLLQYGVKSLSDLELMMALIGTGTRDCPVEQVAGNALQIILTRNKEDWPDLLRSVKGLGPTKAALILAAFESGSRFTSSREIKIREAADLHPLLQTYALEKQEHFVVVSLNGAHEIMDVKVISVGSVNRTVVHPRDVFSVAVKSGASSLVVAHNHPSGTQEPSIEDYQLTERLIMSGKALGIQLIDHLIITKTGFFSFREDTNIFTVEMLSTGETPRFQTYTAAHDSPLVQRWLEEIQLKS